MRGTRATPALSRLPNEGAPTYLLCEVRGKRPGAGEREAEPAIPGEKVMLIVRFLVDVLAVAAETFRLQERLLRRHPTLGS